MAITDTQRKRLEAIAKERGLDIDELVKQAEEIVAARDPASGVKPSSDKPKPADVTPAGTTSEPEQPKLFQYHLPFVTVNEVRTKWLKLEPWTKDKGGEHNAAQWSSMMGPTPPDETP